MSSLLFVRKVLALLGVVVTAPVLLLAQNFISPQGLETTMIGGRNGDQVYPDLALGPDGGFLVWEDNGADKDRDGGIMAAQIRADFSVGNPFRVNSVARGHQRRPQVQLLENGTAIFVWTSNGAKTDDIYMRRVTAEGRLIGRDTRVNTTLRDQQAFAVVSALDDGSAMVVWQSFGQDGSMFGIFGRKILANGRAGTPEIQINQVTHLNQRSPAIATLADGNFIVVWISEGQRFGSATGMRVGDDFVSTNPLSVDVYGRIFDGTGTPAGNEFLINGGTNICANPSVAALANGGFAVAWGEKDMEVRDNSWDIVSRAFSANGTPVGASFKVNDFVFGDQFRPKLASAGQDCVALWTSMGQDGSWEGVYGRLLRSGEEPGSNEFRVNTSTHLKQIHPVAAWDGGSRVLTVWSSIVGRYGFDLFGQTYSLAAQP